MYHKKKRQPKSKTSVSNRRNLFTDVLENIIGTGGPESSTNALTIRNVQNELPSGKEPTYLEGITEQLKSNAIKIAKQAGQSALELVVPTLSHERPRVPHGQGPKEHVSRIPNSHTSSEHEQLINRFKQPTETHEPTQAKPTKKPAKVKKIVSTLPTEPPKRITVQDGTVAPIEVPVIPVEAPIEVPIEAPVEAPIEVPVEASSIPLMDGESNAVSIYQPPVPPIEQIRQKMPPNVLVPDNVNTEIILKYLEKPIYHKGQPNMKNIVTKANIAAQAAFLNLKKLKK